MGHKILWAVLALLVVAGLVFALGPRTPVDTTITFHPASIGPDPDAYLAAAEAKVPGIRDGLQKEIIWAFPQSKAKTPLAIVYVHGFSASKGEVRPLPDKLAAALGANLYYTRLAGHGRDSAAMAEATVNAWINDLAEAVAIGRMIGEKVIIVATSTGGGLVGLAATELDMLDGVARIVFLSPNFGVQASGAWLLTLPWGGQLAELFSGKERSFEPSNELVAHLWTNRYPTRAVLPMAALTRRAANAVVEKATIPALFVISDQDKVVRPEVTRLIEARWGAPHALIVLDKTGDPNAHVNVGDAVSPETTDLIAEQILAWLKS